MNTSPIHENEIALNQGRVLGCLTLDNQAALNATRLDMVESLQAALARFEKRDEVVAILLDAAGERAFCAGGDIVNLYRGIMGEIEADYPRRFFTAEYRLCHDIHRLTTPVIAWGHGIVMGGGCGLFMGASHRVVTEDTRLAMPEIKIGLFPDCAATWFFNRLPRYLARFIMLTGATLNAADCLFAGLAEHAITHREKQAVHAALADASDWRDPAATVSSVLARLERQSPAADLATSRLRTQAPVIRQATLGTDLDAIVTDIQALAEADDAWLAECGRSLAAGCPMTACLIHRQLEHGPCLSLTQAVQRELAMALQCCAHGDFAEGVRALLVDKDKTPRWRHARVADVPAEAVDAHFAPAWNGAHPLADLREIAPTG